MTNLRKILFLSLFWMTASAAMAQSDWIVGEDTSAAQTKESRDSDKCEEGRQEAIRDAREGKYAIRYNSGYSPETDYSYDQFFRDFALKVYGVDFQDKGCVIETKNRCYTDEMYKILDRRFGKGFLGRVRAEADRVYPTTDAFKNFYEVWIEPDRVVNEYVVRTPPEFPGGMDSLESHVVAKLKAQGIWGFSVWVSFVVEKEGKVSEVKWNGVEEEDGALMLAIEKILRETKWVPGDHFGYPVRVAMSARFEGMDEDGEH